MASSNNLAATGRTEERRSTGSTMDGSVVNLEDSPIDASAAGK